LPQQHHVSAILNSASGRMRMIGADPEAKMAFRENPVCASRSARMGVQGANVLVNCP
jgi:hypothetical protein